VRAMRLISQKTTVKMWVFFRSTGMRVLPDA
jgi:hypothetical protein